MTEPRRLAILTVALDSETAERVSPVLGRDGMTVEPVALAADALTRARRERCHLVICRYPLPDMKLREFVAALRSKGSASSDCSLMLLTIPEMTTEARQGAVGGPYLVFSGQEPVGSLGEGAAHLLQVAPRHAPRLMTLLEASLSGDEVNEGRVVNLSVSGMLVTDTPMLPVGAECGFEFHLPNGSSVRGRARVVRHAMPRRERVMGFALRFVEFDDDCEQSLIEWCERSA
jgi:CheY-like chemotaxis protein